MKGLQQFFHKGVQSKKSMTSIKKLDTMYEQNNIKYESRRTVVYDDVNDTLGEERQQTTDIMWKDSNKDDIKISANPQLKSHHRVFQNLLKTDTVVTENTITTMLMTYDSSRIISV